MKSSLSSRGANTTYLIVILQHLCNYSDFGMVVLDRDNPGGFKTDPQQNESMICHESIFGFKAAADKVPHDVGGVFSIRICTVLVG